MSRNSCPICGALYARDQAAGWCLKCAGRDLEESFFAGKSSASETGSPQAPEVPGWKILRMLGSGGMGQLWLAKPSDSDLGIDAHAVIKVPIENSREIAERFETEGELLSSLDHPNILSVVDAGTTADGRLYLATEYVNGCDLRRLLRAERLPPERALPIFFKVCAAIEHAHENGILHRDLKPSNILVDADGVVKVADFGLAKNLTGYSDGNTLEGDGLGTPYYLAPESLRGAADADERADVYALGVLLYELLTGAVPLGSFTPLSKRTQFPKSWDSVLQQSLVDAPSERLGSVAALRRRVESLWSREQRRGLWKKRRHLVALAVTLVAASAFGAWIYRDKPESFPPPESATTSQPWTNSLGINLVPIPDHQVLMATTETSIADFTHFHDFDKNQIPEWRLDTRRNNDLGTKALTREGWKWSATATPTSPGYPVTPSHPITGVTAQDVWAFCTWLTLKERAEGRITEEEHYRLPTRLEWGAVASVDDIPLGNFAGTELTTLDIWPKQRMAGTHTDSFPFTAPVTALQKNSLGIRGIAGNAAEWILTRNATISDTQADAAPPNEIGHIGFSWAYPPPEFAGRPRAVLPNQPGFRRTDIGFRIVLELSQ